MFSFFLRDGTTIDQVLVEASIVCDSMLRGTCCVEVSEERSAIIVLRDRWPQSSSFDFGSIPESPCPFLLFTGSTLNTGDAFHDWSMRLLMIEIAEIHGVDLGLQKMTIDEYVLDRYGDTFTLMEIRKNLPEAFR